MRYYISDLHFYHGNLNTSMDHRGFSSVEDMHQYMISQWNSRVRKQDEVVVLGDFSIGKAQETEEILKQLNGRKFLIVGNHDRFLSDKSFDRSLFGWIEHYKELNDNKRKIILSHYPVFCYNGQNRVDQDGNPRAYMLYGHVHNTYDEVLVNDYIQDTRSRARRSEHGAQPIPCNMINCFCMFSDYVPLTLDEWIVKDRERRVAMGSQMTPCVLDQRPNNWAGDLARNTVE